MIEGRLIRQQFQVQLLVWMCLLFALVLPLDTAILAMNNNMVSLQYLDGQIDPALSFELPDSHPRSMHWMVLKMARVGDTTTVLHLLNSPGVFQDQVGRSMVAAVYQDSIEVARREGDRDRERAAYYSLWELDPSDGDVTLRLVGLLRNEDQFQVAEHVLNQSLFAYPDSPYRYRWLLSLGLTLEVQSKWNEAVTLYQQILTEDPLNARTYYSLGRTYYAMGAGVELAVAQLLQAAAIDPEDAAPHKELGRIYLEERQYQKAVVSLKQASQLAPDDDGVYYLLAWAYQMNGQSAEAVVAIEQALALRPDAIAYLQRAGQIYEYVDNQEAAVNVYRRILLICPQDVNAAQALERFVGKRD